MDLRTKLLATRNAATVPLQPIATPEWPEVDGKLGLVLGSPALVSIALYMERLESGSRTNPLRTTANHAARPDNLLGYGIVDALAAVRSQPRPPGSPEGDPGYDY